jgi:hypothetical protein
VPISARDATVAIKVPCRPPAVLNRTFIGEFYYPSV